MRKTVDFTKPVQTRAGYPARVICTDCKNGDGPVIALVTMPEDHPSAGEERVRHFYEDGRYLGEAKEHDYDLVNVPERSSQFCNVHTSASGFPYIGTGHETKESAERVGPSWKGNSTWDGILELVIEDGQVVESIFHAN
jgi:hypothetical protein